MAFSDQILRVLHHRSKQGLDLAKKGSRNGFFHILGGNTLVKVISALSVLFFPMIMGHAYATFRVADTYISYLLIANGLGMSNVILRYCATFDTPREQKSYFAFAVKFGLCADIGIVAVFCAILYIPQLFGVQLVSFGGGPILAMMLFIVFLDFFFSSTQNFLRTNRENKKYARLAVVFSLCYALIPCGFAFLLSFTGRSVEGAVLGRYVAYLAVLVVALRMLRRLPAMREKAARLPRSIKAGAIKYSVNSLAASGFSLIMPINESAVLSVMVTKAQFNDFQVAQLIPASIQFISNSVIVFAFPYFAKNYLDGRWILKNTRKVVLGTSAVMTACAALGILFAPALVRLFFSASYTPDTVWLMRLFFITFALNSAVRIPIGNILAAVGEVRFNVINAVFTCTVHVAICYAMTSSFGIGGAAYGLLIGYVISSAAALLYLNYYCKKLVKANDKAAIAQGASHFEANEKEKQ